MVRHANRCRPPLRQTRAPDDPHLDRDRAAVDARSRTRRAGSPSSSFALPPRSYSTPLASSAPRRSAPSAWHASSARHSSAATALRAAVWEFVRPMLSRALVGINRDAFMIEQQAESSVDLDAHRARSSQSSERVASKRRKARVFTACDRYGLVGLRRCVKASVHECQRAKLEAKHAAEPLGAPSHVLLCSRGATRGTRRHVRQASCPPSLIGSRDRRSSPVRGWRCRSQSCKPAVRPGF
jgi:hypothetical protein